MAKVIKKHQKGPSGKRRIGGPLRRNNIHGIKDNIPGIIIDGDVVYRNIAHWLGVASPVAHSIRSDFDILQASNHGISKKSIDHLAVYMGISRKVMAEHIFDVSVKTMERKKPNEKLDKKTSSHALEVAKIFQHAFEVFGNEEKAKLWINRENQALNNNKPVDLFDTLTGLNMVNDVLGRIEEGVYS
ncbi:MAG TPA: antitoxin Xre/MbcA/ParS toxin-binding domain-containing protein [Chitinophagaceae bacterium]|jgi:putative toxin-antitoxin system antitoxin component (TIGR02293 family)|nr:antitoxin Xre/MbcA/ParS toxin-binding domain-containing protein [Chitinophagaceae bacterium]